MPRPRRESNLDVAKLNFSRSCRGSSRFVARWGGHVFTKLVFAMSWLKRIAAENVSEPKSLKRKRSEPVLEASLALESKFES